MTAPTDKILVIQVFPLEADGTEAEAIFLSTTPWATAPGDTPGAKPAVALIEPQSFTWEGRCYAFTPEGLFRPGGVMVYTSFSVTVENPVDEDAKTAALDGLAVYSFEDARAVIYLSDADTTASPPTLAISLANLDMWTHARVEAFDLEPDAAGKSQLRLGPPETLDVPSVWFAWRGFGGAALSQITRPDQAALRDQTTSHTWIVIGRWQNAATGVWFNSPLFRIVDNAGTNAIACQFRNAAGSWQGFGTSFTAATAGYYVVVCTYDVADDSAVFYQDGTVVATMTVTGGLYATAASAATFCATISASTWAIAGFQHLAAALTADEVASISRRGIEDHASATCTIALNEGAGSIAFDSTENQNATVTSATWVSTGEGLPAMAETRPPAVIGTAFGLPVIMIDVINGLAVVGYSGERVTIKHLIELLRRQPIQTTASSTRTLDATNQTIAPIPDLFSAEFAPGSTILMNTASAAGNPTTYPIVRILGDPAANEFRTVVVSGIIANENITTTFSDNSDGDWTPVHTTGGVKILRDGVTVAMPGLVLGTAPTDQLQASLSIEVGDTISAMSHVLQKFGARISSPTIAREFSAAKLWHHGCSVPGESSYKDLLHYIALSSVAADARGPLGVYFESDGDVAVRGADLTLGTDDIYVPPGLITSITELAESRRARPGEITVQYQKNHMVVTTPASGSDDRLEAEIRREWKSVTRGSGRPATVDSSLTFFPDAAGLAEGIRKLQGFRVYLVSYRGPITATTIRSATNGPFLIQSVSWEERAAWTTAKQGLTVGFKARPFARDGEPELVLAFATEE